MFKTKLIVGGSGFIASHLLEREDYICTSRSKEEGTILLDLCNPANFDYSVITEDTIVLMLAAISSPDECANNYKEAFDINVKGTIDFIQNVLNKNGKVLFFSSDVVYGGGESAKNENSCLNPVGPYAEMKTLVERNFLGESNFKVFRLSYVFSNEDKYFQYLLNTYKKGGVAEVFDPFDRSVVHLDDVIEAVLQVSAKWGELDFNIVNLCGPSLVSRKRIAQLFKEELGEGFNYSVVIPNEDFFVARPKVINTTSLNLKKVLCREPRDIGSAVNIELTKLDEVYE